MDSVLMKADFASLSATLLFNINTFFFFKVGAGEAAANAEPEGY